MSDVYTTIKNENVINDHLAGVFSSDQRPPRNDQLQPFFFMFFLINSGRHPVSVAELNPQFR